MPWTCGLPRVTGMSLFVSDFPAAVVTNIVQDC